MTDYEDLADHLHLNIQSPNEDINNDRQLALRHLRSGAPIPKTLLEKLRRAAKKESEGENRNE